jgi:hypothetical protein
MAIKNRSNWIWPSITDAVSAKKASRRGVWACGYCAGFPLLFLIFSAFDIGIREIPVRVEHLIDISVFAIIGWGIYKLSRFAAVAGLAFFLIVKVIEVTYRGIRAPIVTLIIMIAFSNSIRGIFAYHEYVNDPSLEVPVPISPDKTVGDNLSPTCPTCGASYDPLQYSRDALQWVCPNCHSLLPRA